MKKKLPRLKTDKAAEKFIATADLTDFDLSVMRPMRFEFERKDKRVNMRLPESLFEAVKVKAEQSGMPYQRFIRQVLEAAVELDHRA